ncbi:NUDIX domain-containing protein [Planomonospora venezuelensis]|uniref:8-oxo-dGTP pyrophosphatase MutT (NUDIX family) n=1 Tax=Planomonospora venezuelensis TaxID=1999 RepID=A0A841D0N8_PLAVE|nr:NUDIX hydrolase [Planomonospora venezuelensis]MBB5964222.1 8-oxo-dGTP pyrophosphatase MutT (NUDIX family) [Planomonospora venezuelensis]
MSQPFLDPAEWYATLPTAFVSACLLLTDTEDRVLLVKPNYRPYWMIPGGVIEPGELPQECAVREIGEELGLIVRAGGLLVVDWSPPVDDRPRVLVNFLFDGGVLEEPIEIRLQAEELDDAAFLPWDEAAARLAAHTAPRLAAARRARKDGRTAYLSGGPAGG